MYSLHACTQTKTLLLKGNFQSLPKTNTPPERQLHSDLKAFTAPKDNSTCLTKTRHFRQLQSCHLSLCKNILIRRINLRPVLH
jgi:hypothetical protein